MVVKQIKLKTKNTIRTNPPTDILIHVSDVPPTDILIHVSDVPPTDILIHVSDVPPTDIFDTC